LKPSNSESYYSRHRLEILAKAKKRRELGLLKINPERNRAAVKRWRDSHLDVARERNHVHFKNWRDSNREKYRAIKLAQACVPLGSCCEFCGSMKNLIRFHFDYDCPKIVITACRECRSWALT
jgi:hypothetical protein